MTRSLRSLENYLLIDNRTVGGPGGGLVEAATLTCCHCQRQVIINPLRTRERNHCRKCHAYVCDSPGCNAECNGGFSNLLNDLASR